MVSFPKGAGNGVGYTLPVVPGAKVENIAVLGNSEVTPCGDYKKIVLDFISVRADACILFYFLIKMKTLTLMATQILFCKCNINYFHFSLSNK